MNLEQQAKKIAKLKTVQLREKYEELYGAKTKSNNRPFLVKKIVKALAAREEAQNENAPETPATASSNAEASAPAARASARAKKRGIGVDPRIPAVGSVIEREYKGKMLKVTVLEDGFRYGGKSYTSLSALAKEITGQIWNGIRFFGLLQAKKD